MAVVLGGIRFFAIVWNAAWGAWDNVLRKFVLLLLLIRAAYCTYMPLSARVIK
jgi:hypothetical protein